MLLRVLQVVIGLLGVLTVSVWLGRLGAIFELATNFRFALLIAATLLMPIAALARQRALLVVVVLVALVHLFAMLPFWTASTDDLAAGTETAQVLQYNILFSNENYEAVASMINESDAVVVGLHEITDEQWIELEPLLTTHPYNIAVPVSEDVGQPGGGMALLSRNPITEISVDSPANRRERPILAFETNVLGQPMTVIGLHPHASRFESAKVVLRNEQLDAVADLANSIDMPVIVVTDMNITPHSPDYKDFLENAGWRDPHRVAGWAPTWPSFFGGLGTPIDHIFISNEIRLHEYSVGPAVGSDHRSLEATISVAPG